MICMHLYLIWNIDPHFFSIFLLLDWWWLTISNLGHLHHLASSPHELAHVNLFPKLFQNSTLMVPIVTYLPAEDFLSCWIIWKDHSLLPCFTIKNIQCHLLNGSSYPLYTKMPPYLVVGHVPLFLRLSRRDRFSFKTQYCPLLLVIAPKCALSATQTNNGFK